MPAQPITHYKWRGNYLFGDRCIINKPDHASLVAAVIAGWAIIETMLGQVFATLCENVPSENSYCKMAAIHLLLESITSKHSKYRARVGTSSKRNRL